MKHTTVQLKYTTINKTTILHFLLEARPYLMLHVVKHTVTNGLMSHVVIHTVTKGLMSHVVIHTVTNCLMSRVVMHTVTNDLMSHEVTHTVTNVLKSVPIEPDHLCYLSSREQLFPPDSWKTKQKRRAQYRAWYTRDPEFILA